MKRLLILVCLLLAAPCLAQTVNLTPADATYVFLRAYVGVDGAGVCDTDEAWRVNARLKDAPGEVWSIASRVNELRPAMMSALMPLIHECQSSPYVTNLRTKEAKNRALASCVASHPNLLDFLSVGGVLDGLQALVNPSRSTVHTGLRCNGDPCPAGTTCDCRRSNPRDPEADCERVASACEHSEEIVRGNQGLTLQITW